MRSWENEIAKLHLARDHHVFVIAWPKTVRCSQCDIGVKDRPPRPRGGIHARVSVAV